MGIGDIIGKITDIFKTIPIPKRKTEDESPAENIAENTAESTQVQEVTNPFLEKKGKLPNLPIKKIMIIAPIVVIVGLLASGIIPINLTTNNVPQNMGGDFEFLNDRLVFVEDQVDYILDQGIGEGGIEGKAGATGPQGKQGLQGIPGEDGKDGVGGIPLMFGSGSTKTQLSKPLYIGVGGGSEDYELVKMISPSDGVIKNLHVATKVPEQDSLSGGINDNVRATLILNGEETELYCNIMQNKCSDIESIVKINAGDMFAVKIDRNEQIIFAELFRVHASVIMEPDK